MKTITVTEPWEREREENPSRESKIPLPVDKSRWNSLESRTRWLVERRAAQLFVECRSILCSKGCSWTSRVERWFVSMPGCAIGYVVLGHVRDYSNGGILHDLPVRVSCWMGSWKGWSRTGRVETTCSFRDEDRDLGFLLEVFSLERFCW